MPATPQLLQLFCICSLANCCKRNLLRKRPCRTINASLATAQHATLFSGILTNVTHPTVHHTVRHSLA